MIQFRVLQAQDVELMHRWLNQGEVFKWYSLNKEQTVDIICSKYFDFDYKLTHRRIIIIDNAPAGYVQWYRLIDYPEYYKLVDALPNDYGLDLFIGESSLTGKGLGTKVIQEALKKLIFENADAKRCLVGPDPSNIRAIKCYEKCGFKHVKNIATDEGEEYLMVIYQT